MITLCYPYLEDGDERRQFEDIYYAYRKQMMALALSILGQREDAEDAVSRVFLRIAEKNWSTVRRIRSDRELRGYLLKATKNTALNIIKTRKNAVSGGDALLTLSTGPALSDDAFLDMICNRMDAQQVVQAIRRMDEKYRDALYYHFLLELTIPETAKALGQNFSATQKQLSRGKKLLLKQLEQKGEDDDGNEPR